MINPLSSFFLIASRFCPPTHAVNDQYFPCYERPSLESPRCLRYMYVTIKGDYIKVSSATLCFAQAGPTVRLAQSRLASFSYKPAYKRLVRASGTICYNLGTFTYLIAQVIGFRHINLRCRSWPRDRKGDLLGSHSMLVRRSALRRVVIHCSSLR